MRNKLFALAPILLLLTSTVTILQVTPGKVSALSASQWQAGRIIDDSIFTQPNSMSVAQIQSFLNSLVPNCDTNGTQPATEWGRPDLTHAQYAALKGWPAPPYVCLRNYYEVPKTSPGNYMPANNYSGSIPAGALSAAQLIYNAAQQYQISPEVLLVMIQKESAGPLTNDTWPLESQYMYPLGAHCPDSTGCDPNYQGFSIQISEAAALFRYYLDNMNQSWWTYKRTGNNQILYNPSASCGSSNVNIITSATAALYTYTPYQPNAAALANLYGTGDSCSSYGNRNFWVIFNQWFGTTVGTPFFQLPGSVKTYMLGADNSYYYITTPDIMSAYGYGTKFTYVQQLASATGMTLKGNLPLIARFEGDGVYAVTSGQLHPFPTTDIFNDFGYSFGQEATLPAWMLTYLPQASAMTNVVKQSDNPTIYYITNGKAEPFCTWSAYSSLGSPTYSSLPFVTLNTLYANTLNAGAPIATEGSLIHATGTDTYGLWDGDQLIPVTANVAKASNLTNCTVSDGSLKQLPASTTVLSNLAKDSDGSLFIIDGNRKLSISSAQQSNLAIPTTSFLLTDSAFLDRLSTIPMTNLYRVNNGDSVYNIVNGKSYAIPSPDDLSGLGYSFSQVVNVSSATSNLFPTDGLIFKPGRLIRIDNQDGVYLVDSDFVIHPFTSAAIFLNYGYSWSNVMNVSSSLISGYSKAAVVSQYVKDASGVYWLIDNGQRHEVSADIAGSGGYNINTSNSTVLPSSILDVIPIGKNLTQVFRAGNTDGVYLIEDGAKRPYSNPAPLLAQGFTWNDVISLSPSYVDGLPTGSAIN